MKYLKHFESKETPESLMLEYKDDIIDVLSRYYSNYEDELTSQLEEIIWDCGQEVSDRLDNTGTIDSETIRMAIDSLEGSWSRSIQKLLDLYYDCRGVMKAEKGDIIQDIREIFADYEFIGKVKVGKSSNRNDDRYIIDINSDDVLLKLDFNEIINRVKSITGLENIDYQGTKDSIRMEFYKERESTEEEGEAQPG